MKCNECIYMRFESSTGFEGEETEHHGTCHRYPPVLVSTNDDYEDKYEPYSWIHPIVDLMPDSSDWCGEFKPIGQYRR